MGVGDVSEMPCDDLVLYFFRDSNASPAHPDGRRLVVDRVVFVVGSVRRPADDRRLDHPVGVL